MAVKKTKKISNRPVSPRLGPNIKEKALPHPAAVIDDIIRENKKKKPRKPVITPREGYRMLAKSGNKPKMERFSPGVMVEQRPGNVKHFTSKGVPGTARMAPTKSTSIQNPITYKSQNVIDNIQMGLTNEKRTKKQ